MNQITGLPLRRRASWSDGRVGEAVRSKPMTSIPMLLLLSWTTLCVMRKFRDIPVYDQTIRSNRFLEMVHLVAAVDHQFADVEVFSVGTVTPHNAKSVAALSRSIAAA